MTESSGIRSSLLQLGDWTLASGRASELKIVCDGLTEADWEAAAYLIATMMERSPFSSVVGVPTGGILLARHLAKYVSETGPSLVVDDVWTTGESMKRFMHLMSDDLTQPRPLQAVLFARGPCPVWVRSVFTLDMGLWHV